MFGSRDLLHRHTGYIIILIAFIRNIFLVRFEDVLFVCGDKLQSCMAEGDHPTHSLPSFLAFFAIRVELASVGIGFSRGGSGILCGWCLFICACGRSV